MSRTEKAGEDFRTTWREIVEQRVGDVSGSRTEGEWGVGIF